MSSLLLCPSEFDDNASVSTVGGDVDALTQMPEPEYELAVGSVEWPDLGDTPQAEECRLQVIEEMEISADWYVISTHKRPGFKRFHTRGNCRLVPYSYYKVRSNSKTEPAGAGYGAKCKLCFLVKADYQSHRSSGDRGTASS